MAYGVFYQKPEDIYFVRKPDLHFYTGFRIISSIIRKRRATGYSGWKPINKLYKDLVTTVPSVGNGGNGYARGVELSGGIKKTFKILTIGSPILTWIPNGNTSISPAR